MNVSSANRGLIPLIWKKMGLKINFDERRVYGLDILRAFAISVVVVTHSISYLPSWATNIINSVALDGVSIFFVLSGFLIGTILIKSMQGVAPGFYTLLNFWWRRWSRTLPVYFLIFSLVLFAYNYPSFHTAPTFKRYYFFSQNVYTPHPGFFIEAWSLSVEEWFYLLIPFITFVFIRYFKVKITDAILIISSIVILFSTGLRLERYFIYRPVDDYKFELYFRMQVVSRLDSIMYGVLGALAAMSNSESWKKKSRMKFLVGLFILVANKIFSLSDNHTAFPLYHAVFFFTLNSAGTLLLLPFLSNYKTGRGWVFKAVTYISLISYSMYLINLTPVQEYVMPFINKHFLKNAGGVGTVKTIDLFLYYPITILGSIYLFKYFETPILKFRDKINFGTRSRLRAGKSV